MVPLLLLLLCLPAAAAQESRPAGTAAVTRLEVLVALYTDVTHEGKKFRLAGSAFDWAELRRHGEAAREFYWRHSGCRLLLVHQELHCAEPVTFTGWWFPAGEARRAAGAALAAHGLGVDRFDQLLALWADPAYDPARRWRIDDVWGGGGTVHAFCSWPVVNSPCWLYVHEFHHALDEFFKRSGYEDYAFNHPTGLPLEGPSGHHFDVNASILRCCPPERWATLRVGRQIHAPDRDGDGLPDLLPEAPFDELRLGTRPDRADTDGDGLDDLAETMAGIFRGADPLDPDTDGDGLKDGEDPFPLTSIDERVPRWDGKAPLPLLLAGGPGWKGALRGGWDDEALTLRLELAERIDVGFELDARGDGRWRGPDNYEWHVPRAGAPRLHLWDARPGFYAYEHEPGHQGGRLLAGQVPTLVREELSDGGLALVFRFPAHPLCGPELKAGSRVTLALDLHTPRGWEGPFERWHRQPLVLVASREGAPRLERLGGFGRPFPAPAPPGDRAQGKSTAR